MCDKKERWGRQRMGPRRDKWPWKAAMCFVARYHFEWKLAQSCSSESFSENLDCRLWLQARQRASIWEKHWRQRQRRLLFLNFHHLGVWPVWLPTWRQLCASCSSSSAPSSPLRVDHQLCRQLASHRSLDLVRFRMRIPQMGAGKRDH